MDKQNLYDNNNYVFIQSWVIIIFNLNKKKLNVLVWSIAGDDLLQRKTVCKKISLDLLNECVSDQEGDLYVTACNALIVLFEQPPTVIARLRIFDFETFY